ncbi:MAG: hypothetical protein ABMA13_22915 [Chthoniobacteraceae bacterium]
MTLRDALTAAIDFIRSSTEDGTMLAAAKALEGASERQRARMERPSMWPHRCHCGERREAKAVVCDLCYPHVPMALLMEWHTGDLRARRKAMRRIEALCVTRSRCEGREAA